MRTTEGQLLVTSTTDPYPARLEIDFPERLSRLSTLFRLILMIPIGIIALLIDGGAPSTAALLTAVGGGGGHVPA